MEGSAQSAVAVRLEDYEEGFLAWLARLGYASRSREAQSLPAQAPVAVAGRCGAWRYLG